MNKLGFYFHVPFCRGKCPYCDFYSLDGTPEGMDAYVAAVLAALALRKRAAGRLCPALVWASAAACGAALYLQICYQNHLVQIHDVGAILDTTDALGFVAGVLLAVTLALDAFALAIWRTEKGKSGADA